jgi:hypothetical protein
LFPVLMLPTINDISTDLEDPPAFTKAKIGRLPESFKAQIRRGYPDLKSLTFPTQPFAKVYDAGKVAATKMPRYASRAERDFWHYPSLLFCPAIMQQMNEAASGLSVTKDTALWLSASATGICQDVVLVASLSALEFLCILAQFLSRSVTIVEGLVM